MSGVDAPEVSPIETGPSAGSHPDAAISVCEGPNCAAALLTTYVARLQELGIADVSADVSTAVAMFMSTMFGDTICRDMMPNGFPQPAEEAPARYVRTFLRSVGAKALTMVTALGEPERLPLDHVPMLAPTQYRDEADVGLREQAAAPRSLRAAGE